MELTLGGHVYVLTDHKNYFVDPNTETTYMWRINHKPDGDKGTEKKRGIETTANTGNVGLVRQQSGDEPTVLKREGFILDRDQELAMWKWFELCKSQTIFYVEFNGDAYEVQITQLNVKRKGSGGPSRSGERFYAEYELEMQVYKVLTGVLAEAGITP